MDDDENDSKMTLLKPPQKQSFWARMRGNFLTGVIVFAPLSITLYLTWTFIDFMDSKVLPLVPKIYNPETYLPFSLPGFGLVVFFFAVAGMGALARNLFGRQIFRWGERLVDRMPVVRSLYNALKQIVETIASQRGQDSFQKVCLVEYPRKGIWAIAFMTTETSGEIVSRAEQKGMVSVFLPTTPNPTSGFLLFVPADETIMLDMTVEEAAKLVISAGLVTPDWVGERDQVAAKVARSV